MTVRSTLVFGCAAAFAACGGSDPHPRSPEPPKTADGSAPPAPPAPTGPTAPSDPARPESTTATGSGAGEAPRAWPFWPPQSADERAQQLDRLTKDPGPIKSNWVPPGKTDRYGHAEGIIQAPVAAVRAKLEDFAHYKELAGPKFKTVRVVDKQGASTDVYFQLPIMRGLITIQYVTRFPPARPVQGGGADVVEGTFVKGNIKDMHIAFTVRPGPDDKSTVMVCDLILLPNVPAPQSALDEELRDACGDAINAVRKTTAASR